MLSLVIGYCSITLFFISQQYNISIEQEMHKNKDIYTNRNHYVQSSIILLFRSPPPLPPLSLGNRLSSFLSSFFCTLNHPIECFNRQIIYIYHINSKFPNIYSNDHIFAMKLDVVAIQATESNFANQKKKKHEYRLRRSIKILDEITESVNSMSVTNANDERLLVRTP